MVGALFSDPGGTQTHDLQNRNLTLYSTELRGHYGCKVTQLIPDLFSCRAYLAYICN